MNLIIINGTAFITFIKNLDREQICRNISFYKHSDLIFNYWQALQCSICLSAIDLNQHVYEIIFSDIDCYQFVNEKKI